MFLREVSDDLLVELKREGNQYAIDLLFERYRNFLYGIINDFFVKKGRYVDYDELYQEAMCIFISCIDKYDENSGCFYFFIRKCIERRLRYLYGKEIRHKEIDSLDKYMYDDNKETKMDYIKESEGDFSLYEQIEERFDELSMKIIRLKSIGYTYEEMSTILSVGVQTIYRRISKIKKILKDITKN